MRYLLFPLPHRNQTHAGTASRRANVAIPRGKRWSHVAIFAPLMAKNEKKADQALTMKKAVAAYSA